MIPKGMLFLLVGGLFFIVGCSGSDDPTGPVGSNVVSMKNIAFAPATLTIQAGETVTWTNDDGVPHTVTSGSPGSKGGPLDSGTISSGGTFIHKFDTPGTFIYFCEIHPSQMRDARIIVESSSN